MKKREYKKPTAAFIDYAYDEQVVAASDNYNGLGDGHYTGYCTYQSGSIHAPCVTMVNKDWPLTVCGTQAWSLRD